MYESVEVAYWKLWKIAGDKRNTMDYKENQLKNDNLTRRLND